MKDNLINLFGNNKFVENDGVKYSKLLDDFLEPFQNDFQGELYLEDIYEFALMAWNFGNLKKLVPAKEFDKILSNPEFDKDVQLMKKMIDYKVRNFSAYTNFIVDYEIEEKNGLPTLTIVTKLEEDYLNDMLNNPIYHENDFEEDFIDRHALILKPRQPFIDWVNNLFLDEGSIHEIKESNIYLINAEIGDIEKWLMKKFDKFFMMELDGWITDKKKWPQKRNYKIFKEWFDINISESIYDTEKKPLIKG